jgi:hypothetical protein
MKINKFSQFESITDSSEITANIEEKLVDFFESFDMDRQWIVDRFNDEDTKRFISYMKDELTKR